MAVFALENGRLVPAHSVDVADSGVVDESLTAIRERVLDLVDAPLFPVAWQSEPLADQHEVQRESLVCLDTTGQTVTVEVLSVLDAAELLGALARAGRHGEMSRSSLALIYGQGARSFPRDWRTFLDACPPGAAPGPRLYLIVLEIDPGVRSAVDALAGAGLDVRLATLHDGGSQVFVSFEEVRTQGSRLDSLLGASSFDMQEIAASLPVDDDEFDELSDGGTVIDAQDVDSSIADDSGAVDPEGGATVFGKPVADADDPAREVVQGEYPATEATVSHEAKTPVEVESATRDERLAEEVPADSDDTQAARQVGPSADEAYTEADQSAEKTEDAPEGAHDSAVDSDADGGNGAKEASGFEESAYVTGATLDPRESEDMSEGEQAQQDAELDPGDVSTGDTEEVATSAPSAMSPSSAHSVQSADSVRSAPSPEATNETAATPAMPAEAAPGVSSPSQSQAQNPTSQYDESRSAPASVPVVPPADSADSALTADEAATDGEDIAKAIAASAATFTREASEQEERRLPSRRRADARREGMQTRTLRDMLLGADDGAQSDQQSEPISREKDATESGPEHPVRLDAPHTPRHRAQSGTTNTEIPNPLAKVQGYEGPSAFAQSAYEREQSRRRAEQLLWENSAPQSEEASNRPRLISESSAATFSSEAVAEAAEEDMVSPAGRLIAIAQRHGAPFTVVWRQRRRNINLKARITPWGTIVLSDGRVFTDPTVAARRASGMESIDGWRVWRIPGGKRLGDL